MLRSVLAAVPLLAGVALFTPASALQLSPTGVVAPTSLTAVRLICRHGQCYRIHRRYSYRRTYRSYARPRYEQRRYYSEEGYARPRYYRDQTEFRGYRDDGPRFGYREYRYDRPDASVGFRREREDDDD